MINEREGDWEMFGENYFGEDNRETMITHPYSYKGFDYSITNISPRYTGGQTVGMNYAHLFLQCEDLGLKIEMIDRSRHKIKDKLTLIVELLIDDAQA